MTVLRDGSSTASARQQAAPTVTPEQHRRGAVAVWATVGMVWMIVSLQALVRWMASDDQFEPVAVQGPDDYPEWREVSLRILEALSMAVLIGFVWFCVIKPFRRDGKLSLDGKFVIGGVFGSVADACLNLYNYLFAWNQHSVDRGVWHSFLPFYNDANAPDRYAEGVLWGVPMYIYFCTGAAIIGCKVIMKLRERFPGITNPMAFSVIFVTEFCAGFLLENTIIRVTQAYGYAQTNAALTLFDGEWYQFPIYESLFTASLGVAFTYVRLSAIESPDGVSCVERGYDRWPVRLQETVRLCAVIGFSIVALIMMYHLPFNWLGVTGDSMADLPSYMLPE